MSAPRVLDRPQLLARAWVDGVVRDDVLVEVVDGRFARVAPDAADDPGAVGAERVGGLTLPGLADAHSHAFHRALRGRAQRGTGSFWTWREQMYALAAHLDPDRLHRLARAVFAEVAAAGWTSVGEFHYLHHGPDGTPYADPRAAARAVVAAAREVGLRIALLDTCYLTAAPGRPLEGVQVRFGDGDAHTWAERRAGLLDLEADPGVVVGAAVHSVRAVPPEALPVVAAAAAGRPLHVHLSEQPAENDACRAAYAVTPARLLADGGVLGPLTTVVHATHLTGDDVALLGAARVRACLCPTTERDLADGVGPSVALRDAGAVLTLGTDSHTVVDPFEEMRAVELDERLVTGRRGSWSAAQLLAAAAADGQAGLGFADAGRIAVGARADLVTLDTASPRTAGTGADEHTAVWAASAADVVRVVVDGRVVATADGRADVGRALDREVAALWAQVEAGAGAAVEGVR
ncbi:formimidoylglutamate deiminase [Nocardioides perillae]|uniref:Formiminoglutamate deiminase n=1 Tax=Nocardioides perillae TaxID=1119534 RepID=A0A7Y9RV42_9ACTN|nr:formimidoylglutamate deiminase [Nocardioides perillae]NYG54500.1 formiminoglutamate deiminase [Nocardioides perillae]